MASAVEKAQAQAAIATANAQRERAALVAEQAQRLRGKTAGGAGVGGGGVKIGGSRSGTRVACYTNSYPATSRGRKRVGPAPLRGSGDEHLDAWSQERLRVESQATIRGNNVARAIMRGLVDSVVPEGGYTFQAATSDPAWNDACERYIEQWLDEADVRGMCSGAELQAMICEACLRDGDVLLIRLADGRLQVIEGDRIGIGPLGGTTYGSAANGSAPSRDIVGGVRIDALGRPIEYLVSVAGGSGFNTPGSIKNVRAVSAENAELVVNPLRRRPSQTRGEPLLAASIERLENIEEYLVAVEVAVRMAAMAALVIKTENPAAMQNAMAGETEADEFGDGQKTETWAPGSSIHLRPGESVEQVKPEHPQQSHRDYVRTQLRIIGADIGLPLEVLLLDFSEANFSSTRAAMAIAWKTISRIARYQLFVWKKLAIWRIEMAMERGELPRSDEYRRVAWLGPAKPIIDPVNEIQAALLAVNGGLSSRKGAIEAAGGDYMETMRQIATERANEAALGLSFPMFTSLQMQNDPAAAQPAGQGENP